VWTSRRQGVAASLRTALLAVLGAAAVLSFVAVGPGSAVGEEHTRRTLGVDGALPTVLIGVPGLRWQDITAEQTPHLSGFMQDAAVAQLSVRSAYRVTCPVDGWLTTGAGRRAAAPRTPGADENESDPVLNAFCSPPADVRDLRVAGWDDLVAYNEDLPYNAVLGQLGDAVDTAGLRRMAVGTGAASALANGEGRLDGYLAQPDELTAVDLATYDLTAIDAATINVREADARPRAEQVAAADAVVGQVLSLVPEGSNVIVTGLADDAPAARLHVLAIQGEDYPAGELTSSSTRLVGLVALTDLTPTLYQLLSLPMAEDIVGAPVVHVPGSLSAADRHQALLEFDEKVVVYSEVAPPFFTALVALQLVLYAIGAWAIRRRDDSAHVRRRVLRTTGFAALVFAAIPAATFCANLLPWWKWSAPHLGLVGLVAGIALGVALLAQLARRSDDLLGEVTVVTTFTAVLLAVDVVGADYMQTASLMGYSPVIAGRFYGFGNVAFSLFVTSAVFSAAFLASYLLKRGHRVMAAGLVIAYGLAAMAVDGLPGLGSDFGGMLAIAPAFCVLWFGVMGVRVTWLRALVVMLVTALVVVAISLIDWLRPAEEQTHLGRFIQQVLDGEVVDIVGRKLENNLNLLGSSFVGVLVPFALIFGFLVLLRTRGAHAPVLRDMIRRAPVLGPALAAWLVAMLIGLAANDSGLAVPAVGIMLTIPILIVISTRVLESPDPPAE
jgi:hypothetical protein